MAEEDPEIVAYRKRMAAARGEVDSPHDEVAAYKRRMAKSRESTSPISHDTAPPPGYTRLMPPENTPPEPIEFTQFKATRDVEANKDAERSKYVSGRLGPMDRGIYEFTHGFGAHASQDPSLLERAGRVAGGLVDTAAGMKAATLTTLGFPPAAPIVAPLAYGTASGLSQYAREKGVAGILGEEDIGSPAERALRSGGVQALTMGVLKGVGPVAERFLPSSVVNAGERVLGSTPGRYALGGGLGAGGAAASGGDIGDIIEAGIGGGIAMAGPKNLLRGAGGAAKAVGKFALRPDVVGAVGGGALGGAPGALIGYGVGSGMLEKIPMFSGVGTLTKGYKKLHARIFPGETGPRSSVSPEEFGGRPERAPEGPPRGTPPVSEEEAQGILGRLSGRPTNPSGAFQPQREVGPPAGMVRDVGERVVKEPIQVRPEETLRRSSSNMAGTNRSGEVNFGPEQTGIILPKESMPYVDKETMFPRLMRNPSKRPEGPRGKGAESKKLLESMVEPKKPPEAVSAEASLKARLAAEPDFEKKADIMAEWEALRKQTGLGTAGGQVSGGEPASTKVMGLMRGLQASDPERRLLVTYEGEPGHPKDYHILPRRVFQSRDEILKANPGMSSPELEKLYRAQEGATLSEKPAGRKNVIPVWDVRSKDHRTFSPEKIRKIVDPKTGEVLFEG